MRRAAWALLAAALLVGCSAALVPRSDVPDLVRDAFQSAGLRADGVAVDRERDGRLWPVTATVADTEVELQVDAEAGRIISINLGDSDVVSKAQLREIAGYSSNPANDRARTRRRAIALVTIVALAGAGLLVARHFRLREERELAETDEEH